MSEGSSSVWIKFALELAAEAVDQVAQLAPAEGRVVVEERDATPGSYKSWDPKTLRIDKQLENYFLEQLAEKGLEAVVLSEEAGRVVVRPRCAPEVDFDRPIYFVSDPFDGSLLYEREIPVFWYTALAIYTRPARPELAEPLAAVVADCQTRKVCFCDTRRSYQALLGPGRKLSQIQPITPNSTHQLSEAFLETYLMKPQFMYPAAEKFKFLFKDVRFILPNGGPAGFCDVASGKVDVYFAFRQPHTDIFPGLAIAERAGCSISTFEGKPVRFEEEVTKRYNLICCANERLQRRVLELLAANGITDQAGEGDA